MKDFSYSGQRLPARQVLARYQVCDRTLARWLADGALNFPKPLVVNGRRYWLLEDIENWERSRVASKLEAA